ncbi:MAG: NAD(P)-dependent oxidoreductase [Microbacterium sp.]
MTAAFDPAAVATLAESHDVVVVPPRTDGVSLAERGLGLDGVQVAVVELDRIDERALAAAPGLELVVACRAAPENVDLDACAAAGVEVVTTPGRNAEVTADFAFALILDTVRHVSASQRWLRAGEWAASDVFESYARFRGVGLAGRRIGIVGGGAVGRRVARRALGFGMEVVVFDPGLEPGALGPDIRLAPLRDVLSTSHIVTLHVPLTSATAGMIGRSELALLRPDAYFVNAARAGLVDRDALLDVLRDGRIAGAGLDVFHREPLAPDDELLTFENVTLTPHIGGASDDVVVVHSRLAAAAIQEWAAR